MVGRVRVFLGLSLVAVLLALAGCVQLVERPSTAAPTAPSAAQETSELFLDVRGPVDGTTVRSNIVVVHGATRPGASVDVNAEAVTVGADGRFQAEVPLSSGANVIDVIAMDGLGNQTRKAVAVNSVVLPPQPFYLIVTEPEDQSIVSDETIRVSGRTGPEAVVSVNGVSVPIDEVGIFSTTVTLERGPNVIDVVAANADGEVLGAVVAVVFRLQTTW